MNTKVILIAVGTALMGMMLMAGCQAAQTPGPKTEPAMSAGETDVFPDFKVKTLEGNTQVALSQYRGKIVILDLFATWCPPCRMEIPHFVDLQKEHADILTVVGLAYDQTPAENVLAFLRKFNVNYHVHWGSEEIAQHVGLRGIPHTLVLDPQGRVVRSYVGYRDKAVFEADIAALQPQKKSQ